MADSEISTSLSWPSRRDILSAALLTAGGTSVGTPAAATMQTDGAADAALVTWKAWRAAHRRTLALCRKHQRLEAELARTIGFPDVVFDAVGLPSPVRIGSQREFDDLAAKLPSIASQRCRVAAALRAHHRRWDEADRAIGYSAARESEAAALDEEERLVDLLLAADACSLRGISAKLDVLIAVGADDAEGRQFPCPELRRIRRDVARLAHFQRQKSVAFTA